MDKQRVRELALKAGFKLRKQDNGNWDLNQYVYEFAAAIEREALEESQLLTKTELAYQRNVD